MQSLHARESQVPTNGDGFGIGWYHPDFGTTPGLFTSIMPAWNNRNLLHLTSKIRSPLFFSHVRAASAGGVTKYNCHPFVSGDWMMMHNGTVHEFMTIKRHIRHLLDDDIYHWIQGDTDSEHIFALYQQYIKGKDINDLNVVADTIADVIKTLEELQTKYCQTINVFFNICLTDGKRLLTCRYQSDKKPASLHYAYGSRFVQGDDGRYHMLQEGENVCSVVASEKLTDFNMEWHDVPVNHFLLIDDSLSITTRPV